jgi:hypothetical protein
MVRGQEAEAASRSGEGWRAEKPSFLIYEMARRNVKRSQGWLDHTDRVLQRHRSMASSGWVQAHRRRGMKLAFCKVVPHEPFSKVF